MPFNLTFLFGLKTFVFPKIPTPSLIKFLFHCKVGQVYFGFFRLHEKQRVQNLETKLPSCWRPPSSIFSDHKHVGTNGQATSPKIWFIVWLRGFTLQDGDIHMCEIWILRWIIQGKNFPKSFFKYFYFEYKWLLWIKKLIIHEGFRSHIRSCLFWVSILTMFYGWENDLGSALIKHPAVGWHWSLKFDWLKLSK